MGLIFFLLHSVSFALGLDNPPEAPESRRPTMSKTSRLQKIRNGDVPNYLIPYRYNENQKVTCLTRFYDENGDVYRTKEGNTSPVPLVKKLLIS